MRQTDSEVKAEPRRKVDKHLRRRSSDTYLCAAEVRGNTRDILGLEIQTLKHNQKTMLCLGLFGYASLKEACSTWGCSLKDKQ
jgi:hypothetical protein